jgi:hypothetical protein
MNRLEIVVRLIAAREAKYKHYGVLDTATSRKTVSDVIGRAFELADMLIDENDRYERAMERAEWDKRMEHLSGS